MIGASVAILRGLSLCCRKGGRTPYASVHGQGQCRVRCSRPYRVAADEAALRSTITTSTPPPLKPAYLHETQYLYQASVPASLSFYSCLWIVLRRLLVFPRSIDLFGSTQCEHFRRFALPQNAVPVCSASPAYSYVLYLYRSLGDIQVTLRTI